MPIPSGTTATTEAIGPGVPGALLHDGQLTLGDVVLGIVDGYGVEWVLEGLTGWSDPPPTTGDTQDRASDHGGWVTPAYYGPRVIGVEGTLVATSWLAASAALDRLMGSVPLSALETLYIAEGAGRLLQADVRQEGDPLVTRLGNWARFSLSLIAPDPRRYSTEQTTLQTGFPSTTGGLTLPLSLPLSVNATTVSGVITAVNAGNMATSPVFTVHGPAPAFAITHVGTGRTIRYHDALPAGRSLVIDTGRRRALLDGTSPRVVTGAWFDYEPGVNEVAFSATTYNSAALLVSTHRSAWR